MCPNWQYCPLQCGHKQRFHLQGLASQNAFFKIKPSDFLFLFTCSKHRLVHFHYQGLTSQNANFSSNQLFFWTFVDLYLYTGQYVLIDNTVLSSTMRSPATFPPSRFSLSSQNAFFSSIQLIFLLFGPVQNTGQWLGAHRQYRPLHCGHKWRFHLQGLASQAALFFFF